MTRAWGKVAAVGLIAGLLPRVPKKLTLAIANRGKFPIRVTSLKASARDAGPSCRSTMLRVRNRTPDVVVRPRSKRRVSLKVRLSPAAGDGCQGARLPLRFEAAGERA